MRTAWLAAISLVAGCVNNFDFDTDATTITATGQNNATDVAICADADFVGCAGSGPFQIALDATTQMAVPNVLSFGELHAEFAALGSAIAVTRGSDGAAAHVVMPAPFQLTGPTAALTRGATVQLAWDVTGADRVVWTLGLQCGSDSFQGPSGQADDTGTLTIAADRFPAGDPGTCSAGIQFAREQGGTIDAAFNPGSTIVADQSVLLHFQLIDN